MTSNQDHRGGDGTHERCLVAPHPDARRRLEESMNDLRSSSGVIPPTMLRLREPISPGFNDGLVVPGSRMPVGSSLAAARAAAADRSPLRGTVRIIVVLVDFDDQPMTRNRDEFEDLFFSTGKVPTGSVKEYFRDVSTGSVDIEGEIVGPYRLPLSMAQYANNASGTGNALPNARTMAEDAAQAADADIDFSPYDNDGDGYVDAFIVVHAGTGAEMTLDPGHIWSHKWVLASGEMVTDTTRIYAYLTVPEDCRIGVCCHEIGHLAFGWPDLYDIDSSSSGLGDWCLMAGGSWNGGGDVPAHPSAWCKATQGWVTVVAQAATETVDIPDVKDKAIVYRLWKDGAGGQEYFLVENRQRGGYDQHLPGQGLLVYHVDDSVPTNANEAHYKVGLVQADGQRHLEQGVNQGDGTDPYPGDGNNTAFTGTSNPASHSHAGVATSVSVTDIGAPGRQITATLAVSDGGKPPVTEPTLRFGSRGEAVERLQRKLTDLGFEPGPIDGIYGVKTVKGVKRYQRSRGLIVDGICGPQTWAALNAEA